MLKLSEKNLRTILELILDGDEKRYKHLTPSTDQLAQKIFAEHPEWIAEYPSITLRMTSKWLPQGRTFDPYPVDYIEVRNEIQSET